jgi:hypothetical protein
MNLGGMGAASYRWEVNMGRIRFNRPPFCNVLPFLGELLKRIRPAEVFMHDDLRKA